MDCTTPSIQSAWWVRTFFLHHRVHHTMSSKILSARRSSMNKYLSFGAKIVKIRRADPEIFCLLAIIRKGEKKEINASKISSPSCKFAERAKQTVWRSVKGCQFCKGFENRLLPSTKPVAVNTGLALMHSPWYYDVAVWAVLALICCGCALLCREKDTWRCCSSPPSSSHPPWLLSTASLYTWYDSHFERCLM